MATRQKVLISTLVLLVIAGLVPLLLHILDRGPEFVSTPPVGAANCLLCHGEYAPREGYIVHQPVRTESCTACHIDHTRENVFGFTKPTVTELCLTCHSDESENMRSVHKPYGEGNCLSCHDAHQSPYLGMLVQEERNLCLDCHSNMQVADNWVVHEPFEESCIACHSAHATDFDSLLSAEVHQLCFSCHSNLEADLQKSWQHEPFTLGNCLSCHEAHSSPVSGSALLVKAERSLCLDCHANDVALGNPVKHRPFQQSCVSCHESHAADFSSLLIAQTPDLCYSCHSATRMERNLSVQHEPFSAGNCSSCHDAHTSPVVGSALLVREERSLCLSCHTDDVNLDNPMSHRPFDEGCISCHQSHAGSIGSLLTRSLPNLCYSCHALTRMEQNRPVQHKPFSAGNCSFCHDAHTSPVAGSALLVREERGLCLTCHANALNLGNPVSHSPFNDGCVSCHQSHAGSIGSLLTATLPNLCYSCHTGTQNELALPVRHEPFGTGNCSSCHESHTSPIEGSALLVQEERSLCLSCHDQDVGLGNPVSHSPFEDGCNACHQSHAGTIDGLLTVGTPGLCFGCHTATGAQRNMPVQHDPFGRGNCLSCHETHTSTVLDTALLTQSLTSLCYSCHSDVEQGLQLPVQHQPFAEGDCASCHNAHAAPAANMLFTANRTAFCSSCHTATAEEFAQASRHPIGAGVFNCSTCHTAAHAGENRRLLLAAGNTLCGTCHVSTVNQFAATAHSGIGEVGRSCYSCHAYHGSPYQPLLRASEISMCITCHDGKSGSYMSEGTIFYNHPLGAHPELAMDVSCSSCHTGIHGPATAQLLPIPLTNQLCMICHTQESLAY